MFPSKSVGIILMGIAAVGFVICTAAAYGTPRSADHVELTQALKVFGAPSNGGR